VWWIVRLNPFTPFTLAYQEVLFYGRWPTSELWLQMALVSTAFWLLGTWLFERLRETLVEAV
jgi:ABC-type polysaccharide/polyol phosphate export permease